LLRETGRLIKGIEMPVFEVYSPPAAAPAFDPDYFVAVAGENTGITRHVSRAVKARTGTIIDAVDNTLLSCPADPFEQVDVGRRYSQNPVTGFAARWYVITAVSAAGVATCLGNSTAHLGTAGSTGGTGTTYDPYVIIDPFPSGNDQCFEPAVFRLSSPLFGCNLALLCLPHEMEDYTKAKVAIRFSSDGGRRWVKPAGVPDPIFDDGACIGSFGLQWTDGKIYAGAYLSAGGYIYVSSSADGITWSARTDIGLNWPDRGHIRGVWLMNDGGVVRAYFTRNDTTPYTLWTCTTAGAPDSQTWTDPELVTVMGYVAPVSYDVALQRPWTAKVVKRGSQYLMVMMSSNSGGSGGDSGSRLQFGVGSTPTGFALGPAIISTGWDVGGTLNRNYLTDTDWIAQAGCLVPWLDNTLKLFHAGGTAFSPQSFTLHEADVLVN
jgi:hypothetical protein